LPDKVSVDTTFLNSEVTFISDQVGQINLKVFETIFKALQKKQTLSFDYRALENSDSHKRQVDPYHAICQRGNWYFIGYCHYKKAPRLFAFSRVKNASLTKDHYEIPEDFKPDDFFDKEIGVNITTQKPFTIELEFEKEIALYALERQWHSTQTVRENEDGSIYVKFTTTQVPEVLRLVLAQKETVKVLAPLELIEIVKSTAEKIAKLYS
jgi:predicted DNA-binding transcriptional regulator YafY